MSEDVSRRKMLSMLGLGAALGFTLSGVLEPLEAEAQEAAPATPNPTALLGHRLRSGHRNTREESADIATRAPLAIAAPTRAARHGKPAVPPAVQQLQQLRTQ